MDERIKALLTQPFSHLDCGLHKKCWTRSVGNHVAHYVVDALRLAKLCASHEDDFLHRRISGHAVHDLLEVRSPFSSPRSGLC